LSEYDVKGEATVKFDVGSSKISAADKEETNKLAQIATGLKGYIIEVTGYADSIGSSAMNTKLSGDRAKAVVTFLIQQGNVPMRHIVALGAMGEYGSAAPNETKSGRAENRRVELKVFQQGHRRQLATHFPTSRSFCRDALFRNAIGLRPWRHR
jgi:OmpA-OmpF porin, OOP family